jgi:hypothetical protein
MSNRSNRRRERATPYWQGKIAEEEARGRGIVTPARREALQCLAIDEPEKFIRFCRLNQVVSLGQLPFWPEIRDTHPYEALRLELLARGAGISVR